MTGFHSRHRPGHDLVPRHRLRHEAEAAGLRPEGIQAVLSRSPAGWSMTRKKSGHRCLATCKAALSKAKAKAAGHRGHRHHQPARDRGGLGPQDRQAHPQGHRLAGPAHGGNLRGAEGRRAIEPLFTAKTGLLLDPYFSGTKIALAARQCEGRAREGREAANLLSAPSTASSSGG